MATCPQCEQLPSLNLEKDQLLYINHPTPHTLSKIKQIAQQYNSSYELVEQTLLALRLTPENAVSMAQAINDAMSDIERNESIGVLTDADQFSTEIGLGNAQPLSNILGKLTAQWLIDLLKQDKLVIFLQPIVEAQNEQIHGYECLLRAYDEHNQLISPKTLFDAASSSELLFYLDRQARIKAIRTAQYYQIEHKLFINFNPNSIYDPVNCLRTTTAEAHKAHLASNQIVFEIIESERIVDFEHLQYIVNYYRSQGFQVALDDLGSGFNSLNLLSSLKPDLIKLDMHLTRNIHEDPFKQTIVENIVKMTQKWDITSLAEGVETAEEAQWLSANGLRLLQGFYYGKPSPRPYH